MNHQEIDRNDFDYEFRSLLTKRDEDAVSARVKSIRFIEQHFKVKLLDEEISQIFNDTHPVFRVETHTDDWVIKVKLTDEEVRRVLAGAHPRF